MSTKPPQPDASAAPKTKLSFKEKFFYGIGSGSYQLSGEGVNSLGNPVYNITLGLSPTLIGVILMISRLFDAFTDPIMGKISDDTRTRWGRRRPYIFVGCFLAAFAFILLWQVPESWAGNNRALFTYYLCALLFFNLCATVQVIPYHTLGMELTSDYHERTVVAGYKMVFSFTFSLLIPWVFRLAQSDYFGGHTMTGIRHLSYIIAGIIIVGGVLPAIFSRERYYKIAKDQARMPFWKGAKLTLRNRPFLILTGIILTSMMGPTMVGSLSPYIIYYHIHGGDTKTGAELVAIGANTFGVLAILSTALIARLARRLDKIRALRLFICLSLLSSLASFILFSRETPYLVLLYFASQAPVAAGFWTLINSMKADICDDDELATGNRREGMFGSIGNWITKVATSVAFLFSGVALDITGFDVALKGDQAPATLLWMRILFAVVPALSAALALVLLHKYPLSSARMAEIRATLETRRQKV